MLILSNFNREIIPKASIAAPLVVDEHIFELLLALKVVDLRLRVIAAKDSRCHIIGVCVVGLVAAQLLFKFVQDR